MLRTYREAEMGVEGLHYSGMTVCAQIDFEYASASPFPDRPYRMDWNILSYNAVFQVPFYDRVSVDNI